jgi:hypothetical protein
LHDLFQDLPIQFPPQPDIAGLGSAVDAAGHCKHRRAARSRIDAAQSSQRYRFDDADLGCRHAAKEHRRLERERSALTRPATRPLFLNAGTPGMPWTGSVVSPHSQPAE